jgi:hypothetical protein
VRLGRHQHQWTEVGRTFCPPRLKSFDAEGMAGPRFLALMREAQFGLTTVELRCEVCGDVASRSLAGDHT